MPYLQPYLTDQERQRAGASSAPSSSSGTSGGTQAGTAANGAAPQSGSGQFQAITSYFQPANAQQFAGQVAGKIGAQAQDAQSDFTKQQGDYQAAGNKAVDAWSSSNDKSWSAWNEARDAAAKGAIPGDVKGRISNWQMPAQAELDAKYGNGYQYGTGAAGEVQAAKGGLLQDTRKANQAYSNAWDNYQPFQQAAAPGSPTWSPNTAKAREVTQEINALDSDAGRQGVLGQLYGNGGGYTAGMSRLDSALLGSASPSSGLRSQYGGLESTQKSSSTPGVKAAAWQAPGQSTKRNPYNYDAIVAGLGGLGHT